MNLFFLHCLKGLKGLGVMAHVYRIRSPEVRVGKAGVMLNIWVILIEQRDDIGLPCEGSARLGVSVCHSLMSGALHISLWFLFDLHFTLVLSGVCVAQWFPIRATPDTWRISSARAFFSSATPRALRLEAERGGSKRKKGASTTGDPKSPCQVSVT